MSLPQDDPILPRHGRALVVMAREPHAGSCKTRLCPPLSPEEAAALYRAFLIDVAREMATLDGECDLWVAWSSASGPPLEVREIFPAAFRLLPQRGESLTARMEHVFERLLAAGYREVLMRNSDSPHLPISRVRSAFEELATGEPGTVVIGPDLDGGFYLVGMGGAPSQLFPTTMGTPSVLAQTRALAEASGRPVVELEPFPDIDTATDLRIFWLEFGSRRDVRDWATWQAVHDGQLIDRLE